MTASTSSREQRHRRVTEAVRALIAEQGLHLSMEAVAARAGCSKQTLYAQYGSKDALLRRVVLDRVAEVAAGFDGGDGDLRAMLLSFAAEHLEHLADPTTVAARRLILAEAHRYADEASALFEFAVAGLQEQIAARLQAAMAQGRLRAADPAAAAELLLAMIAGADLDRRHFGVAHRDSPAARRAWAQFAVDSFLRAFAPDSPSS